MTQPPVWYAAPSSYPVNLDVATPDHIERWRPLVHWLMAIPLLIVAAIYLFVAEIVLVISWFAALITGSVPEGLAGVMTAALRFAWRATAFLYGLETAYPAFSFPGGYSDPGEDPAYLDFGQPEPQSRLTVLFRGILAIPHLFVLYFLGLVAGVAAVIAWFAVLFTATYPPGLRNFMVGYFRWQHRVQAYLFLLTGVYPPFSMT